jgi:hypothetical protein
VNSKSRNPESGRERGGVPGIAFVSVGNSQGDNEAAHLGRWFCCHEDHPIRYHCGECPWNVVTAASLAREIAS